MLHGIPENINRS